MIDHTTTICAIATPPGVGAIAVIRVSGSQAFEICNSIVSIKKNLKDLPTHTTHFCRIVSGNEIIDEVLITLFKAPHSYTGEDTIEISCHGSIYIQQKIMELLLKQGAVLAQPGEFTLRAFLNGKMDLSQAEAVADLIQSTSQANHQMAMQQMRGEFSKQLETIRQKLIDFASLIELELDFSEEDVEFADRESLKQTLLELINQFRNLADSFQYGNVVKNGVPVAIIGKPNVGKSTLLNTLLNEEKAIVSDIPGTTRDVIEDTITLHGILFRFIDTAGIRHTLDVIENMGIERTLNNVKKASIILFLTEPQENIENTNETIESLPISENQSVAIIINKIDKISENERINLIDKFKSQFTYPIIPISAKNKYNIEEITSFLFNCIHAFNHYENSVVVTNIRHYEALLHSLEAASRMLEGMENNLSNDLLAEELRQILYYIGTITGNITNDEILGNIFKNFCIGK